MMRALAQQALRLLVAPLLAVTPLTAGINHWTPVGPPGGDPGSLAASPSAPGVVYLGCNQGIFRSEDGGAHWRQRGLVDNLTGLIVDPQDAETLYASINVWSGQNTSLLETHDAGKSWSSTNFNSGVPVQMLFADHCLYALTYVSYETTVSFFRRLDGGAWQPIVFLPSGVWPTALAASPAGIVHAATTLGAYRSRDRGATWRPSARSGGGQTARPGDYLVDVTVVPGFPDAVLTSGYSGIWRSEDSGATWQPSSAGLYGNAFEALAVASDSTVYTAVGFQGFFRSRDRGTTWRKRTVGLRLGPPTAVDFTISALATDPRDPARVYAAIWDGLSARVSLAQTTDAGDHWQSSSFPGGTAVVWSLQVDPAATESLYAIAAVNQGILTAILHSSDGGESWSRLLTDANGIFSLAIDPLRATTLYAGTFDRFLKSVDGGRTWRLAGRGLPQTGVSALAVEPQDPHRLYACPGTGGVYVSSDQGETFHPMNRGLPAGTFAYQLVIDPRHSFLYLLDVDRGIFRWLPEEHGWTIVEDGLPPQFRNSDSYLFAIDPARPDVLYAGGQHGLFQLTVR